MIFETLAPGPECFSHYWVILVESINFKDLSDSGQVFIGPVACGPQHKQTSSFNFQLLKYWFRCLNPAIHIHGPHVHLGNTWESFQGLSSRWLRNSRPTLKNNTGTNNNSNNSEPQPTFLDSPLHAADHLAEWFQGSTSLNSQNNHMS